MARESAAEQVHALQEDASRCAGFEATGIVGAEDQGPDVAMPQDLRPPPGEDAGAERIDLDLPEAAPPCPLQPEIEAADPREDRAERRRKCHSPLRASQSRSHTSRTAPRPPVARVIQWAACRAARWASAGAMAKPTMPIAPTSGSSSPM